MTQKSLPPVENLASTHRLLEVSPYANRHLRIVFAAIFLSKLGTITAKSLGTLAILFRLLINTPLSPSNQCWFMEDIHAAHISIYLQITLMDVSF